MLRLAAAIVLLSGVPAAAMNWEGHDDWMLGFAPGYTLEAFAPDARPLPRRDCPVSAEDAKRNLYEQIPLSGHNCPGGGGQEMAKPRR